MVVTIIANENMKGTISIFLLLTLTAIGSQAIRLKQFADYIDQSSRVVGGEIAEKGFAPYQISLQLKYLDPPYLHWCGGAIIHKDWVITAGHCVFAVAIDELAVVTGTNHWKEPGAMYYPDSIHRHCSHKIKGFVNDIALLHLNSSIVFNEMTKPVPLPTRPMKVGAEVILTGWGATSHESNSPDELHKVHLKFVERQKCLELLNYDRDYDIGHICTFTQKGEGSCHGDSGGPLVSGGYLVGIVNWGYPCAIGYPDVHASAFYYRDWIRRTMSENSKC